MGIYLNPGNSGFQEVIRSEYVDKTGLIDLVNHTIGTKSKLTCISRPRRFGKSFAAQMLCAYYDCSCDSHWLFDDKDIAKTDDYCKHLNQYHVIDLDITSFVSTAQVEGSPLREVPLILKLQKNGTTGMIIQKSGRFTILILSCRQSKWEPLILTGKKHRLQNHL